MNLENMLFDNTNSLISAIGAAFKRIESLESKTTELALRDGWNIDLANKDRSRIEAIEKKLECIADSFDRRMDALEGEIIALEKRFDALEDEEAEEICELEERADNSFNRDLDLLNRIKAIEAHLKETKPHTFNAEHVMGAALLSRAIAMKVAVEAKNEADKAKAELSPRAEQTLAAMRAFKESYEASQGAFDQAVEETHKAMCAIVPDWDLPQEDLEKQYVAAHKRFLQLKTELDMRSVRPMIEQLKADAFEAELSE